MGPNLINFILVFLCFSVSFATQCFPHYKPILFGNPSCFTVINTFDISNGYFFVAGAVSGSELINVETKFPIAAKIKDGSNVPEMAVYFPDFPDGAITVMELAEERVVLGMNFNYKVIVMVLYQENLSQDYFLTDATTYGTTSIPWMILSSSLAFGKCLPSDNCLFISMTTPDNYFLALMNLGGTIVTYKSNNQGDGGFSASYGEDQDGNKVAIFSGRNAVSGDTYDSLFCFWILADGSQHTQGLGYLFPTPRLITRTASAPDDIRYVFMCSIESDNPGIFLHYAEMNLPPSGTISGFSLEGTGTFSNCYDIEPQSSTEALFLLQKSDNNMLAICNFQSQSTTVSCPVVLASIDGTVKSTQIYSASKIYFSLSTSMIGSDPWNLVFSYQASMIVSTDDAESCIQFPLDSGITETRNLDSSSWGIAPWVLSLVSVNIDIVTNYQILETNMDGFIESTVCGPSDSTNAYVDDPTETSVTYCIGFPETQVDVSFQVDASCDDNSLEYTLYADNVQLPSSQTSSTSIWYSSSVSSCTLSIQTEDVTLLGISQDIDIVAVAPNSQTFEHTVNLEFLDESNCLCAKVTCPTTLADPIISPDDVPIFYSLDTVSIPTLRFEVTADTCQLGFEVSQRSAFTEVLFLDPINDCLDDACELDLVSTIALPEDVTSLENIYEYEIKAILPNDMSCSYLYYFEIINSPCAAAWIVSSFNVPFDSPYIYDINLETLTDPTKQYFSFSSSSNQVGCNVQKVILNSDNSEANSIFSLETYDDITFTFNINTNDPSLVAIYHLKMKLYIDGSHESPQTYQFIVQITNQCLTDITVDITDIEDQAYLIGEDSITIPVTSWDYSTSSSINCGIFSYQAILIDPDGIETIIPSTISTFIAFKQISVGSHSIEIQSSNPDFASFYNVRIEGTLDSGFQTTQEFQLEILAPCEFTYPEIKNSTFLIGTNELKVQIPIFTDPSIVYCPKSNYRFVNYAEQTPLDPELFKVVSSSTKNSLIVNTQNNSKVGNYEIEASIVHNEMKYAMTFFVSVACNVFYLKSSNIDDINIKVGQHGRTTPFDAFTPIPDCGNQIQYFGVLQTGQELPSFISFSSDLRSFQIDATSNNTIGVYYIQVKAYLTANSGSFVSNDDITFVLKIEEKYEQNQNNQTSVEISTNDNNTINPNEESESNITFQNFAYASILEITNMGEVIIQFDTALDIPENYKTLFNQSLILTVVSKQTNNRQTVTWEIIELQSNQLNLQVHFDDASNIQDLYVYFNLSIFRMKQSLKSHSLTILLQKTPEKIISSTLRVFLKKQYLTSLIKMVLVCLIFTAISQFIGNYSEQIGSLLQSVVVGTFAVNVAMYMYLSYFRAGSMSNLWAVVNVLQIILHTPLFSLKFPENAATLFSFIIQISQLDFVPYQNVTSLIAPEDKTDGSAFSEEFEATDIFRIFSIIECLTLKVIIQCSQCGTQVVYLFIYSQFWLLLHYLFCLNWDHS